MDSSLANPGECPRCSHYDCSVGLGVRSTFLPSSLSSPNTYLKLLVEGQGYFMDVLGCCLWEAVRDKLVQTLRCQYELSSSSIHKFLHVDLLTLQDLISTSLWNQLAHLCSYRLLLKK